MLVSDSPLLPAFPPGDFRFRLGIRRCDPVEFWQPGATAAEILTERSAWLSAHPDWFADVLPEGAELTAELAEWLQQHGGSPAAAITSGNVTQAREQLLKIGRCWVPDVVLLRPDADGQWITVGGVVCFPSSWSLPEKLGLSMDAIHEIVPGLNDRLQPAIHKLLSAIKAEEGWTRSNWGAASSGERNQHPQRQLRALTASDVPQAVWLRCEHQLLWRLPRTGGLVFAIRIEQCPLLDVMKFPTLCQRWARSLQTIPEEMLRYKRLEMVREALVSYLQRNSGAPPLLS